MYDFIQKQIEASERLYNMMMTDHKERFEKIAEVYALSENLQKKLNERDAEIAKLRQKLRLYESADFM
jgi:ABC-type enterochelin transport system substrate-binding protein